MQKFMVFLFFKKKVIYFPNNQGYPVSLFKQNKIIHNKL